MNISASAVIVFLVCMMASSIEAGSWNKPQHPWNHRPQGYRPSSSSNSNVNINTNKNDNTNINNLISSLLSQLTANQPNTECVYGDVYCFEKMLGSGGPAKSQEPAQEDDQDAAASGDENADVFGGVEKASDNSKHYRPMHGSSRTSNTNFNSNSNSNSNNDLSSIFASLQQILNSNQRKVAAAKEAPVA